MLLQYQQTSLKKKIGVNVVSNDAYPLTLTPHKALLRRGLSGGAKLPKYEPFDFAAWLCSAGGVVIRVTNDHSIFKMLKRDNPLEGHCSVAPDQAKQICFA